MEDPQGGPRARYGQLHGNSLRILAIVAAVTVVLAVWQFSSMSGGGDDPFPQGPLQDAETAQNSLGVPSTTEADSVEASSFSRAPSPEASTLTPEPSSEAPETDQAPPASESPDSPEPQADCTATLEMDKDRGGWIQVDVEVVNTGELDIESWEVTIAVDGVDVQDHWGMRRLDGDRYGNEDWNGRLEPDDDADASFQAEVDSDYQLPASVPCAAFD